MAPRRATLLAGLLSTLAATVLIGGGPAAAASPTVRFVDIPGDGVTLEANVVAPTTAGSHPAVILPAPT